MNSGTFSFDELQPFDSHGQLLDAKFSLECNQDKAAIIWYSRDKWRNTQYNEALEIVLARLGEMRMNIFSISLSRLAKYKKQEGDLTYRLSKFSEYVYPVDLFKITDYRDFRIAIGRAGETVAQSPKAKSGNRTRRIRITFGPMELSSYSLFIKFTDSLLGKDRPNFPT